MAYRKTSINTMLRFIYLLFDFKKVIILESFKQDFYKLGVIFQHIFDSTMD